MKTSLVRAGRVVLHRSDGLKYRPAEEDEEMEPKRPFVSNLLSGMDAAFLYLERKEIPLGISMVCVFDGIIPFRKFVANIEAKLHLLPRYRQIVVAPPFDIGYPTWEDDPRFDIRRHIFRARLPAPGGDAELEAFAGRLIGRLMDRTKPLWEIHVITGLENGRGALLVRLHHALADGVSGVAAIMEVMLDRTPEVFRTIPAPPPWQTYPPAADHSVQKAVADAVYSTLDNLISAGNGLADIVHSLRGNGMQSGLKGLVGLLPELIGAVERLPFNKPCTGERRFCWAEFGMPEVQAIRRTARGTVNDVVLTVLVRAIARYTELHGESVVNRLMRIVCPVNLRQDSSEIGNRISFLPVVLPLDIVDPVKMLEAVAARMEIMKKARAADLLAVLGGCLGAAPAAAQAALCRGVPQLTLPFSLFNMICTNIPGSREPLYSIGRRMLASYPQVPTGYELGINCAVTSYDGKLFFGLISDSHAAPDANRLRDFLYSAFEELCVSAGIKRKRRKAAKPKPRRKHRETATPALTPQADPLAAAPDKPARLELPCQPITEINRASAASANAS